MCCDPQSDSCAPRRGQQLPGSLWEEPQDPFSSWGSSCFQKPWRGVPPGGPTHLRGRLAFCRDCREFVGHRNLRGLGDSPTIKTKL